RDMGANAVDMMDENDRIAKAIKRINKDEEDTLNIYMDKLPEQIITEKDLEFVQVNKEEMLDTENIVNKEEALKENIEFFNEKPICERINVPQFPEFMEAWFLVDKTHINPYGVPPTLLLQALTTSSASDGFNLERLETIDDEENNDEANGWGVRNENEVKSIDGVETIYLKESKGDDILPYSYNYLSQQYISDKAIADCVEALIGAHLIALSPSKTLDFMKWLGIKVLTEKPKPKSPVETLAVSLCLERIT
uniref:Uncharacterized protein n=1 Tax=Panagrolaimus sp. PS1159 TaxID=55785 RepID=A0AC35GS56_9BILA